MADSQDFREKSSLAKMVVGQDAVLRRVTNLTFEDLGYLAALQTEAATYYGYITAVSFWGSKHHGGSVRIHFAMNEAASEASVQVDDDPFIVVSTTQRQEKK